MRMAYLEDDGRKLLCLTITKAPSVTMPTICFGLKLKFGSNSCRVNPKSSDRFFTRSRPLSAVIDPLILTMSSDCTVASFRCKFRPMYLWFFRFVSTHPRKWKICLYCWFAQPILAWNLSWFCLKERNIFFMTFLDVGILRPWSAQPFWMSLLFSSFYIGNKSTTNSLARTTSAETFFCKHEWIVSCFCLNFASTSFCSELFCKLMPSFFCKWYIGDVVTCSGLNLAEQHFTTESSLDLTRTCFQTSDFLPVSFFQPLEFDMMDLIC